MKLFALFPLIGCLALACAGCQTGEAKPAMAVINTREVVTKCNAGIAATEKVRAKFAGRQEELRKQEEAIARLKADPGLSDPKSGKQAELEKLARQFLADGQTLRKDVGDEESAAFGPIVDRINKVLAQYAKDNKLLSVQDKNGFAYLDPSLDITAEIIKLVDQVK